MTAEMIKDEVRVGVFVCHCGSNIAGVVDIPQLIQRVERLPNVALATDFMFTCSAESQPKLIELIQKHELNRVVVAACSPKTHEPLFRKTLQEAEGLFEKFHAMVTEEGAPVDEDVGRGPRSSTAPSSI